MTKLRRECYVLFLFLALKLIATTVALKKEFLFGLIPRISLCFFAILLISNRTDYEFIVGTPAAYCFNRDYDLHLHRRHHLLDYKQGL
jgi:hypothetical protein